MYSLNTIMRWIILAFIGVALMISAFLFWKAWSTRLPSSFLIPNVTYFGQYLGTELSDQQPVAVRTILNYWGNTAVTNQTLLEKFETMDYQDANVLDNLDSQFTVSFFNDLGFVAERKVTSDPDYVKLLIANNIPVYVKQNLGSSYDPRLKSIRVYIGYSDRDGQFIVHDNNFGNNYTISYDEYEKISNGQVVVLIHPQDYQISKKSPYQSADPTSYPVRLAIMDDLGLRDLQVKWMALNLEKVTSLRNNTDTTESQGKHLQELVSHEAFTRLHPAAQMSLSFNLATFYIEKTQEYEKAIKVLEETTLPLVEGYDFSKPYGGWDRKMDPSIYKHPFFSAAPWTALASAYFKSNQVGKAKEALNKALSYDPSFEPALRGVKAVEGN